MARINLNSNNPADWVSDPYQGEASADTGAVAAPTPRRRAPGARQAMAAQAKRKSAMDALLARVITAKEAGIATPGANILPGGSLRRDLQGAGIFGINLKGITPDEMQLLNRLVDPEQFRQKSREELFGAGL